MTTGIRQNIKHQPFDEFIKDFRKHTPLPFEFFIEDLRRQGFIIGVEHYFRVQTILRQFSAHQNLEQLKLLLCPAFATGKKQQELFYLTFDRYFHIAPLPETADEDAAIQDDQKDSEKKPAQPVFRKWVYTAAASLWIVLFGLLADLFLKPVSVEPPNKTVVSHPITTPPSEKPRKPDMEMIYRLEPAQPASSTWYQRHGKAFRWTAAAAPLIICLLTEWYFFVRRRLAVQRSRSKEPPFIWNLRVQTPPADFLKTPQFYASAHRMRKRQEGDLMQPDIRNTIDATVKQMGFPTFKYQPATRPPEYLFLIDLPSYNDHYAGFMDAVSKTLADEGVYVKRFFYSGDPQVCFPEAGGKRLYLSDLKDRFSRHRLFLVGDCGALLHPETGEPEAWTEIFSGWDDRIILTPVPPSEWGMREVMLAKEFMVLPAALNGLEAAADCFDSPVSLELSRWTAADMTPPMMPEEPQDIGKIRSFLGDEDTFQWLCACAVYPELNWRLTLYLGVIHGNRITEDRLCRMIRLPWLRNGCIPDDLRLKLIAELDPETLQLIRQSIFDVLEKDPPPPDSAAWDLYQLNLAIHRKMISKEDQEKAAHLKAIQKQAGILEEGRVIRDYTLLRILESEPASPLATAIPKKFHRLFFRSGLPLFGLRTRVRTALAILITALILLITPAPEPIQHPPSARSLKLRFAHIPAGEFMMGSPEDEKGRSNHETLHKVTLTKDFYMQTTEVTQGQWQAVMGVNPSYFQNCGDDCPVETVSWDDVQEFIRKLNQLEGKEVYRLPTEAEWEYAARAGTSSAFANGDITNTYCKPIDVNMDAMGWYCGNSEVNYPGCYDISSMGGSKCAGTHPVGGKQPNNWGLYDMHGNVWEWCLDSAIITETAVITKTYKNGIIDPLNESGFDRILRGGSWNYYAQHCRSAIRGFWIDKLDRINTGIRLVVLFPNN